MAQQLEGAAPGSNAKPAEGTSKQEAQARPNARTVTLAVTPDQAQRLILAEEKGKIRLALRPVEDHSPADVDTVRLSDLRP